MWARACVSVIAACGFPSLPKLNGGDGGDGDSQGNMVTIAASPSSFVLHPSDARDVKLTVTNGTSQMVGAPTFGIIGLTLGSMTFTPGTCTDTLAGGASCTATAHLAVTSNGQQDFQVTVAAGTDATAMATLSLIVRPCASSCGQAGATNCCASAVVPGNASGSTLAGQTFYRSHDVAADGAFPSTADPATVSDYRLDTYEVTVGRFRAFVAAGMGTQASPPATASGAHAAISGTGWDAAWNSLLPATTSALQAGLKCDAGFQTWTDTVGANEVLPINCVTWYEAMAFCIWDGGYLPTEAEWNYAASGGTEQRAYPWSNPAGSTTIDCSYANYRIDIPVGTDCVGSLNRVGSESPTGNGKWGHADLSGNAHELIFDWYAVSYANPCNDCANLAPAPYRVVRSGYFFVSGANLRTGRRFAADPTARVHSNGFRCARAP